MKALDVAGCFIDLANNTSEHDLTNLKLQKLLYFSQGKYSAIYGEDLFGDIIEAWKYGPVVSEVYQAFKECGSFPITCFDVEFESEPLNETAKDFVQTIWHEIGEKYSAIHLFQQTHAPGTPWSQYYKENQNVEIPKQVIAEYFKKHDL